LSKQAELVEQFNHELNPDGRPWIEFWRTGEIADRKFLDSPRIRETETFFVRYDHPVLKNRMEFVQVQRDVLLPFLRGHLDIGGGGVALDITLAPEDLSWYLICNHDGDMLFISHGGITG